MEIQHRLDGSKGKFFVEESGEMLAQMTYSVASSNMIIIDHTEVSEKLEGKGAGKELVKAGVEYARKNGIKIILINRRSY